MTKAFRCQIVSLILIGITQTASAADTDFSAPLCKVLRDLNPKAKTLGPEGTRAQLTMATAEAFDYDPEILNEVKARADGATTTSCPVDRDAMLAALKMKTLSEALR